MRFVDTFLARNIFKDIKTRKLVKEGDKFVNLDLARTLQTIADKGSKAFYEGPLADTIVKELNGSITTDDLKHYT